MPYGFTSRSRGTRYLLLAGMLACGGCNIFGGGPVPNPFPPIPDAGVIVRVRNEISVIVDATVVYTDDGVEVRRTNLILEPSAANQYVEIEKTVVDRVIALATVSAKNTSLPSNLKVGDPLFAKVFVEGTDFSEGDVLTIVIRSETPVVQPLPDCNNNLVPDVFEITLNPALDCDANSELDSCEIAANPALDCDHDGKLTACDSQAPVITHCPEGRTVSLDANCSATLPDLAPEVQVAQNCNLTTAPTITQSPPAGTLINAVSTVNVTMTVRDEAGLEATCVVQVLARETIAPVITCPPDLSIECGTPLTPHAESNVGNATATDNCDASPAVTYADQIFPNVPDGDTSEGGGKSNCGFIVKRTWTATDASSNTSSCLQTIVVTDSESPSITCPPDVMVECGQSDPGNPYVGTAEASDNCDASPYLNYYDYEDEGSCSYGLQITRVWYAIDDCGNYAECEQHITIIDTQPPVLTVPPDITVQCDDSTDPKDTGCATAIDACSSKRIITHEDEYPSAGGPGGCNGYTIIRHWTATDQCENSSTADQIITIVDTEPPHISECPANLNLSTGGDCTVPLPDMTKALSASDNCSKGYSVYQAPEPGTALEPGTHIVTFTVIDDCGNSSQCTAQVEVSAVVASGVLFVDQDAYYGDNDGTSWEDAFTDLSQALTRAGCAGGPIEIWVAEGTYRPDGGTGDRYRSFELGSHIKVYGGFAGGETELGQRDPTENPVVLSGELGHAGISDNSLHVVKCSEVVGAVLDGVTITRGNANVDPTDADAGGLLLHGSSPLIRNCRFVDNRALLTGGAIVTQFDSHPIIEKCAFEDNTAAAGGAIRTWSNSSPVLKGCLFVGNSATLGGAVEHAASSWPTYVNCVFAGNTADGGGAVANTGSTCVLINCTLYANNAGASQGGGIRSNGGNNTVTNCLIWGNNDGGPSVVDAQIIDMGSSTTVSYSCIQDGQPGDGVIPFGGAAAHNIDLDPLLTFPSSGKFTLNPYSPCIDAGNNASLPPGTVTDFAGHPRVVDGDFDEFATVDMGALEFQGE